MASSKAPPEEKHTRSEHDSDFIDELAAKAAAQSQTEDQTVPEQRPQGFTQPSASQQSESSKRFKGEPAHGKAEYDAAAPTKENEERAAEAGRVPNFLVGQRVKITGGSENGRMAYVMSIAYADPIQAMIAQSGTDEARFADVAAYIVRTRDGRSDLLTITPPLLTPLEENNGWGRGTI